MSEVFISEDKSLLQVDVIHQFLSEKAYWCLGIPKETVIKAIESSLCFGLFQSESKKLIGFTRVVTDGATFAWICDVFILDEYRKRGYSKLLMDFVMKKLKPMNLRRISLATKDAHSLYKKFGFNLSETPQYFMEIKNNDVYKRVKYE